MGAIILIGEIMKKSILVLLCVTIATATSLADMTEQLDSLLTIAGGALDGASLIVALDGATIYDNNFGWGAQNQTVIVASATKWLSAVVFMTLVDDSLISLLDTVGAYLPAFADERSGGSVQFSWDASGQASGVYFIQMVTPEATMSKRVVLLK